MKTGTLIQGQPDNLQVEAGDVMERAKSFIRLEASALQELANGLTDQIRLAAAALLTCRGKVFLSGVGKSRLVGQKISATLSSTGTPSVSLDPTDALHGDIGQVSTDDLLFVLSNSGETEELGGLVQSARRIPVSVIAMTGNRNSSLGRAADIVLDIGQYREACPLGLAPTTTATVMMALGDALALVVLEQRGFSRVDFGRLHPGGSLGKKLGSCAQTNSREDSVFAIPPGVC